MVASTGGGWPTTPFVRSASDRIAAGFAAAADPAAAVHMAAYMRDQFEFYGIPKPARVPVLRNAVGDLGRPDERDLRGLASICWEHDEREWQYAGCWLLRRFAARTVGPGFVEVIEHLVTHRSWWDTVDDLAQVTGDLVLAHPSVIPTVEAWIEAEDIWLVRASLLHQLSFGAATDSGRLFAACDARLGDREPFIRKAIGWALRQHSRTDPDAVKTFVRTRELSPLSAREALRWMAHHGDAEASALLSGVGRPPRTTRGRRRLPADP